MLNKCLIVLICIVFLWGCSSGDSSTSQEPGTDPSENEPSTPKTGIEWDQSTLMMVSSLTSNAQYSGYARIIKLHDGTLICVYEADGNIVTVKSNDNGAS